MREFGAVLSRRKNYLFGSFSVIILGLALQIAPVADAVSSEYDFFNPSPAGDAGGLAIPASCPSDIHSGGDGNPAGWNGVDTPCTSPANNCGDTNSGLTQCDGNCSAGRPADRGYVGQYCQSLANNCGERNTGGFLCNGDCDAPIPDWVPLGDPCLSSGTNSCGMRGDGQITCTGCNATVPPNSACGQPCGDGYCDAGAGETCDSCRTDCVSTCPSCTNGSFCNGVEETSEAGFPNNHFIQDRCNCGDPGSGWVQVGGPAGACYHHDTGATCGIPGTPPPAPDLKINGSDGPVTVVPGANLNITWNSVADATSCSGSGPSWTGGKAVGGGNDNISATSSATYTINCTGPGGSGSDSVVVTVNGGGGGNNNPTGDHNSANCTDIYGWACDADSFATDIDVHLYIDGPAGSGTFLGVVTADQARGDAGAIASFCGGNGNRGWSLATPAAYKNGLSHSVYAYGINVGGGINTRLRSSPRTFQCSGSFVCTGTDPVNADLCSGDDSGLVGDTAKRLVSACTPGSKCEYTCRAGYVYSGGSCVPTGGTPPPAPDLKINGSDGPVTVVPGANLNITWNSVADATSCSGSGPSWTGGKAVGGGNDNISATSSATYTINCTGPGGSGSDSVVVTVNGGGSCPGPAAPSSPQTVTASPSGSAAGSGPFTTDSTLSLIAQFLGAAPGTSAILSITPTGCQSGYVGSTRNGATTSNYAGSYQGMNISCTSGCSGGGGGSCGGSVPSDAASFSGETTGVQPGDTWHYSALDTVDACEFYCPIGTWDGTSCQVANCDGSTPLPPSQYIVSTLIANARPVWGRNPFTTDSDLPTIARFMGVNPGVSARLNITDAGCRNDFRSGYNNGITTRSFASNYQGMLVDIPSICGPLPYTCLVGVLDNTSLYLNNGVYEWECMGFHSYGLRHDFSRGDPLECRYNSNLHTSPELYVAPTECIIALNQSTCGPVFLNWRNATSPTAIKFTHDTTTTTISSAVHGNDHWMIPFGNSLFWNDIGGGIASPSVPVSAVCAPLLVWDGTKCAAPPRAPDPTLIVCPNPQGLLVGETRSLYAWFDSTGSVQSCTGAHSPNDVATDERSNWSRINGTGQISLPAKGQVRGDSAGNATVSVSYGWNRSDPYYGYESGTSNASATVNINPVCTWSCDIAVQANTCIGDDSYTVTDSCGHSHICPGSRTCDFNWKEVAP